MLLGVLCPVPTGPAPQRLLPYTVGRCLCLCVSRVQKSFYFLE